jgi:hypothetical protein
VLLKHTVARGIAGKPSVKRGIDEAKKAVLRELNSFVGHLPLEVMQHHKNAHYSVELVNSLSPCCRTLEPEADC